MKTPPWLGVLEKNTSDSQRLVIHFTQSGAMMLRLSFTESKPKILQYSTVTFDPSMTEQEKRNGFQGFLTGLKGKSYPPAALTWPDGMVFRQLELPVMPPDDLLKAIDWDLKKKFYYNPEENFLGFNEVMGLEGAETQEKLYNIFYCEKTTASARFSFVQDLGIEIRFMIPSQVALSNFAGSTEPTQGHDVLVCELDGAFLRIMAVRDKRCMLVRQVTVGVMEPNFTDDHLKKMSDEIKKTIDFYESQKYFRPIEKIILTGAWDDESRVNAFLEQRLEVKIVQPDLESYVSESLSGEDKDFIKTRPGLFAAALGAGIADGDTMNLVPVNIKTKNRERRLHRRMNLVLLGTALLMALLTLGVFASTQLIKTGMRGLETEFREITKKKEVVHSILDMEKVRRLVMKSELYSPSLLKELSHRTPAAVTLNELEYSRQDRGVILRGEIPDSPREGTKSLTQFTALLSESPFFSSVNVAETRRDEQKKALMFELNGVLKDLE